MIKFLHNARLSLRASNTDLSGKNHALLNLARAKQTLAYSQMYSLSKQLFQTVAEAELYPQEPV